MLKFKIRNLVAYSEDHSDLLSAEIEQAITNLNKIFEKSHKSLTNNPLKSVAFATYRLNPSKTLYVISLEERDDNPVLLVFDSNERIFKQSVDIGLFKNFSKSDYVLDLDDNVRDIGAERFTRFQTEEINHRILEALDETPEL